jgi:glycosyltransferase involved in cell wall biosynthesis
MLELSIVIPTRDEVSGLEAVLEELHSVVIGSGFSTEVVVVDDASTDGTIDLAKRLAVELPLLHLSVLETAHPNGGFGALLRFGTAYASGRYVIVISADGSDPVELIPDILGQLRKGAHLVICSRYVEGDRVASVGGRFRLYQRLYRQAIRLLLGHHISDSTNGFRGFDRRFALALGLSSNRFSICPELTFKTLLSGGTIGYVEGLPRHAATDGVEKFKLPNELPGYAHVLVKASLHRAGLRWF